MFSLQKLLMTKPNTKSKLGSRVDQIVNQHSVLVTSFTGPGDPLAPQPSPTAGSWPPANPPSGVLNWGSPRVLTGRGGAWLRAGALHFSAVFVHTPAEVTLPVALQGHEVAQVITLGHILVIPGRATIVLQQVFPPALTDGPGPLRGL